MASVTGRAGSITVNGTVLSITKWSSDLTKELADSTDSSNFDTGSNQLYKSQVPGAIAFEGDIEFNFDLAGTSSNLILSKLKSDTPLAIVFKINAALTYASGNFDLSKVGVSLSVPGATMVTVSAHVMSNGIFTIN